jgi:hypothetical protein
VGFFETELYQRDCHDQLEERSVLPHIQRLSGCLTLWHSTLQWNNQKKKSQDNGVRTADDLRPLVCRGRRGDDELARLKLERLHIDYFYFISRARAKHVTVLYVSTHGIAVHIDSQAPLSMYDVADTFVERENHINTQIRNACEAINYTFIEPSQVYNLDVLPVQLIFNANCIEFGACHMMAYLMILDLREMLEQNERNIETVREFFKRMNSKAVLDNFYERMHRTARLLGDRLYNDTMERIDNLLQDDFSNARIWSEPSKTFVQRQPQSRQSRKQIQRQRIQPKTARAQMLE